jgi:transglutaminase-like putative cysteine protease
MLKKILVILITILGLSSSLVFADTTYYHLDESDNGLVIVTYPIEEDVRYKVMLEKDGEKYYYDLMSDDVTLPLQMGEGQYNLTILKHVSGVMYSVEYEATFEALSIDVSVLYLSSIINIDWSYDDTAILYLNEIISPELTVEEKVNTIHVLLTESLSYDAEKFSSITGGYLPDVEETFITRMGLCYDFSSLFAAMLRSEGIETKLVMGFRADTSVFHAWNEVLINDEWIIVDLTLDVEYFGKGYSYELSKDSMFYDKLAEY